MRIIATSLSGLACALVLAACGGGGGSTTSAVGKKAATPRAAFSCLEDAGINVKSTPPNNSSVVSAMVIASGKPDQVELWFMTSPGAAKKLAADVASYLSNSGGDAKVIGKTAVVGTSGTANDELDRIEGCATS